MANNKFTEIEIPSVQSMDEILKPSDRPVAGDQRLVRHLPAIPGMKELFPCIWLSPYTVKGPIDKEGTMVQLKVGLLLISKGPPKPEVVGVFIQPKDLDKFPMAPVEW